MTILLGKKEIRQHLIAVSLGKKGDPPTPRGSTSGEKGDPSTPRDNRPIEKGTSKPHSYCSISGNMIENEV